jgi:hypothetical protein
LHFTLFSLRVLFPKMASMVESYLAPHTKYANKIDLTPKILGFYLE